MITVYIDGGAKPNPGIGAMACIIEGIGQPEKHLSQCGDRMTNNQCEYIAFNFALKRLLALNMQNEQIVVHTDSQMLVGQLQDGWKANRFLPYYPQYLEARGLMLKFSNLKLQKVPREENKNADRLVEIALGDV